MDVSRSVTPRLKRIEGNPDWQSSAVSNPGKIVEHAQRLSDERRRNGEHGGPLTHVTIRVLRVLLFNFANRRSGVCFPSYKVIAEAARCAERTVERAVSRLEAFGVLQIHPRFALWGGSDGREVRVRTSNGYTFPDGDQLSKLRKQFEIPTRGWRQSDGVTSPLNLNSICELSDVAPIYQAVRRQQNVAHQYIAGNVPRIHSQRNIDDQLRFISKWDSEYKAARISSSDESGTPVVNYERILKVNR